MNYRTRQEIQELAKKYIDTNLYGKSVKFSDKHILYSGQIAEIIGWQINQNIESDETPFYIVRFLNGECYGVPAVLTDWHYFGITLVG